MSIWHWLIVAGLAVGTIWHHGWYGVFLVALMTGVVAAICAEQRHNRRWAKQYHEWEAAEHARRQAAQAEPRD